VVDLRYLIGILIQQFQEVERGSTFSKILKFEHAQAQASRVGMPRRALLCD
jgi:hypothetical protein